MNNSKARKQLEKQLAIGMALVNGANTFAPMALLYARPDQVLGKQQALPDWQQPVAARVSASEDRKPYSATNLQSLAYAAMSAADAVVFGKAEAGSKYIVPAGSTSTVDTLGDGDVMSISGAAGNSAIGSVVIANGWQYVYAYGVGNVTSMNAGGAQYISAGGNGTVSTMSSGVQYVSSGGSGTVITMSAGEQDVSSGGNGTVTTLNGGSQIVNNGGVATAVVISGLAAFQNIASGGSGVATSITLGGRQNIAAGGYGSAGTIDYGVQTISSGGVGSAGTIGAVH